ncbi:MAG TPA: N-6 DNA methylase [Pyrinomonadaceae bacterium]|jgi:hypothetical protein|nr:N-6 DNA methylase [Pyrinomonadaceae bacterium]
MTVPTVISDLVESFNSKADEFNNSSYKEARLRIDFIDPFFEALGWDMRNEKRRGEIYREVVYEDSLKIGKSPKAPDYSFRVGNERKFFVETKPPSTNLQVLRSSSYQLRRYAWSANLPLSILTNFREFAVYDGRVEPKESDEPFVARIFYCTHNEYILQWDKIAGIFSREAAFDGTYDAYAWSLKAPRGSQKVDTTFLQQIESWRETLAQNIALQNDLTDGELNDAVQRTLDRIIFLRICEDRGIEEYGRLQNLLKGANIYAQLCILFHYADQRYNSGLFHFEVEKSRPSVIDDWTLKLRIDDEVLSTIIKNLYYPYSPYEFSVIPVDILGQVYEQFLGKVIEQHPKGKAEVKYKPEVQKAGGVYYTPTYIVDYIVEQVIGKLCEGKKPEQVKNLRILDPACGSGSFLIGAYQYLLNWHLQWYLKNEVKKHAQKIYQGSEGLWYLTSSEKKRILLNNIYGVDIDAQAVEVTKLSLMLKVIEGESAQSVSDNLRMFHERALPDLDNNIKCGNSLIGFDFYQQYQASDLSEEEHEHVNVFEWKKAFPDIMKQGGFDAVIGNPPYIRIQTSKRKEVSYFNSHYSTAVSNYDIYCLFVEKGINLLKAGGFLGYILPHRFFKTDYGEGLRDFIVKNRNLNQIIDFDGYMVFDRASINTCILILSKNGSEYFRFGQMKFTSKSPREVASILSGINETSRFNNKIGYGQIPISTLSSEPWIFLWEEDMSIWKKLDSIEQRLGNITTHIFQGLKTSADGIYIGDTIRDKGNLIALKFKIDNKTYEIEADIMKPLIKGGEMQPYHIGKSSKRILFPYENGELLSEKRLRHNFPRAWAYLTHHKEYLENREEGKMKGNHWYAYGRSQALSIMTSPKIITPDYYAHASYCLDEEGTYFFCGGGAGGYGIVLKTEFNMFYVLGLLNSKLLDWYLRKITMRAYQTAYMYTKKYIEKLPIQYINPSKPTGKALHDQIAKAVKLIITLNGQLLDAKTDKNRAITQSKINAQKQQINELVYELYGLSNNEAQFIENIY